MTKVDFEMPGVRREGFAGTADAPDDAEILEGVGELGQCITGRDGGVTGDGGGAGDEDGRTTRGLGHDRRAGEAGGLRAVLGGVGVGGNLARIFKVARGLRRGGEGHGEDLGFHADGGGGRETGAEVGAEGGAKREAAATAEAAVIFEAGRAGSVDAGDVVPDAGESTAAGGAQEIAVEAVRGGFGRFAGPADGAAKKPIARAVKGERPGITRGLRRRENGLGRLAAEHGEARRPSVGFGVDGLRKRHHGVGN